jgi:hypothetical protein
MVTVPIATPVTTPVFGSTVALLLSLDDQVPPDVASVSVIVDPAQTEELPLIAPTDGAELTVTVISSVEGVQGELLTVHLKVYVPAAVGVKLEVGLLVLLNCVFDVLGPLTMDQAPVPVVGAVAPSAIAVPVQAVVLDPATACEGGAFTVILPEAEGLVQADPVVVTV